MADAHGKTMKNKRKPTVAVVKFASCDGCQLTLLDCEDELLAIADRIEFAHFAEASSDLQPGPYDLTIVEGSISTTEDMHRIVKLRAQSKKLITIGACATAGGVQALRNFADSEYFKRAVYASPETIESLAESTPIASIDRSCFGVCSRSTAQDLDRECLSALQKTRHGLRCGRPKETLFRPCDPSWLRIDLPSLRSRLLRMLRTIGAAQHARPFGRNS
jgi:Ni,Fe-hydrogenase III small subunit